MYTEKMPGSDGRSNIETYWFIPDNPTAAVQITHGMSEHIMREGYIRFAEYLSDNGIAVCAMDMLGHGRSADKDDMGYFAPKDGYKFIIEDMHSLYELARKKLPGLPRILFGHSMGSILTEYYIAQYPDEHEKAVLMGSLGPMPFGKQVIRLAEMISEREGDRSVSMLLQKLSFGTYLKKIASPVTDYDWLSSDPEEVKKYCEDPLCGFFFKNAAMVDLYKLYEEISRKDWPSRLSREIKLLFVSGEDDPCGGYGRGVKAMADRVKARGISAELLLYPGRHELLNEYVRAKVFSDILSFINEK